MTENVWRRATLLLIGLALSVPTCSPTREGAIGGQGPETAGDNGHDGEASSPQGGNHNPTEGGDPSQPKDDEVYTGVCDSEQFDIAMEPVRVMILLDQSSSMGTGIDWGQTSHWKEAAAGLEHLLNDERNRGFFFGLDPFPDATLEYLERCNDPCCMDPLCLLTPANALRCLNLTASCGRACTTDLPPIVPLGRTPESGPEIIQYMNYSFLPDSNGLTPLIDQLRYYLEDRRHEMPEFYSGDGSSYLLIVSDGAESCQTTGAEGEAEAIAQEIGDVTAQILERHGVMSFAIGFGDTTGTMADQLNAIAENGGTLFQSFFPVSEEGALQEAFDKIAATIVSCVYDIGEPSAAADPDRVNFFFDGQPVGHDPTCMDGWNWTAESTPERPQVEFCGPSCERLMDGLVSQIGAEFGCSTFVW